MVFAIGGESAKEDFIKFLENNALYLCLGIVGIIIVTIVVVFIIKNRKKNSEPKLENNSDNFAELFGGVDNVISYEQSGSRINLICQDYSRVDLKTLEGYTITSSIQMSDRLILVSDNPTKFMQMLKKSLQK